MKQAGLKLKMSVRSASNIRITNNSMEMNGLMLNSMLFVLAALALWYVLILGNMVFDIVGRKTLEKEMLALSGEVSQLELVYLSTTGGMDMAFSSHMGFKETAGTFATRKSLGSLNTLGNEI